jgi:Flp pilus assembly protein TadB
MKFLKAGQRGSNPLRRWFHQTIVGKLWKLSRILFPRWLFPLILVTIPLIILLALALFFFLSFLIILGFVVYLVSLRPRQKLRRGDKMIEAEYWIEPEDKR